MEYKNDMYKGIENKEDKREKDGCYKDCNLYTGVSLPVEITPDARVGKINVECCGDPTVKYDCCMDKTHKIVVTQRFLLNIPVCYQIKTRIGECESDCKCKD